MLEALRGFSRSLRFRLVAAASFVLVLMLALLIANSIRLMDATLAARENQHLAELQVLLNAAFAESLAQRDPVRLAQLARRLREDRGMVYLVLADDEQRVLVAEGWAAGVPLPPRQTDFSTLPREATRFDGMAPLSIGGRPVGNVYFGIRTDFLREASYDLLWQSVAIGWAAFVMTVILLSLIGYWLTRGLRTLQRGVAALENGEATVRLPVVNQDEIGTLTRAFNRMAQALDERVDALKKSEARFHAIADYTYGVEGWFNQQGRLIWINRSVERITGYTPLECLLSASLVDMLVFEKDRRHALEIAVKALRGSAGDNFEVRLRRKDGSVVWVVINWQPIYDAEGGYVGLRVSGDDIQARKEAELKLLDTVVELRRAQALKEYYLTNSNEERSRLEALLNVMKVGVLFVDSGNRVVYANKRCRAMWGIGEEENMAGMRDAALLDRTAALRQDDAAFRSHIAEVTGQRGLSEPYEFLMRDGRAFAEVSALVPGVQPKRFIGRVWIYEDVTRQKQLEAELIQLAERDPLTNLYNRRRFHEELDRIIADASRRKAQAGLLAVDLDGFKPINDEFGHQAGDQVLTRLAEDVGATVRRNEIFFRVGGDEFAILAPDTSEEEMIGLAARVGRTIAEMRFHFAGHEVRLTASLGIALYPTHAANGEEIVARADSAMYQAKMSGKNRWAIFNGVKLH